MAMTRHQLKDRSFGSLSDSILRRSTWGHANTLPPGYSNLEAAVLKIDSPLSGGNGPVQLALDIQKAGEAEWDCSNEKVQPQRDTFSGWSFPLVE